MPGLIHWRDWSGTAFADATARNAPILLFLVTAWSEACASMESSVFGDATVASLVEERFVAVRVDADRRPDVNERYCLGGWPTIALLTPDGEVLHGAAYAGIDEIVALLSQTADAWRARAPEIRARALARRRRSSPSAPSPASAIDRSAVDWMRALLVEQFDAAHGGFGSGAKTHHASALALALSLADTIGDETMRQMVEVTLDRMSALWDPADGGFFRYAGSPDWNAPGTEKTLEDNAALLGIYLDAAIRLQSEEYRNRAGDLVRWLKSTLGDPGGEGFFNSQAAGSREIDRSVYIDRNAVVIGQLLRAAALFDDPWLRDFALKTLETVMLPGYTPGGGVAHQHVGPHETNPAPVRRLLGDQVHTASALVWAHVVAGQLPHSMLAAELMQFAVRTMWDERAGCFRDRASDEPRKDLGLLRDPVMPFALNCEAACVLDRLATLTGDAAYRDRALSILRWLGSEYRRFGLFGAPYALALHEVIDRHPPPGLHLSPVDWGLEHG